MLERPLVLGLFWALVTGESSTSLSIAIFFELLWLDLIPVGMFLPPHLTAATLAALSLTTFFHFTTASQIMLVLFVCMPLAWLGARLEGALREQEQKGYNRLLHWSRVPESSSNDPSRLIFRSLLTHVISSFVFFYVCVLVLKFTLQTFCALYPSLEWTAGVSWSHLWIVATLGGLMSLRLTRVYGFLISAVLLVALFMILH